MSDSAQDNRRFQILPPISADDPPRTSHPSDASDANADALRLLIGALLVGGDEFLSRLQRWDETARSAGPPAVPQSAAAPPPLANGSQSLRYALFGLLFESEARVRRRFSRLLSRFVDLSDVADYVFATRLAPAMRHTPLDPLVQLLDEATFAALSTLDRWTARGWLEEQQGRRVARLAASSIVDELFAYMARNPDLRELIEKQSTSMAEDAVDHVRERTASADMWIERLAHSLLHRPLSDAPSQSAAHTDSLVVREHGG